MLWRDLAVLGCVGLAACSGPASNSPAPAPVATPAAVAPPAASPEEAKLAALVELARIGPTQKQYPQADSVIAADEDDVTLQPDGTLVEHHHQVVRILNPQRGKERFADVHIAYDVKRQALVLNLARTINGDGQVHVASGDEIADIVPPELASATIYASVLERVVSFPAVDKGSVIELDYTRTTHAGPDAAMGGDFTLADWDPVLSRRVTLTVPAGQTLKYVVEGTALAPVDVTDAGVRTLTFAARNVPAHDPELGSPPPEAVLPRLVFSFLPDWTTAAARLGRQFFVETSPPEPQVAMKVLELQKGPRTPSDDVKAMYSFVAHDIRTIGVPLGLTGWTPTPPETVLANGYGDERDKVRLFLAMCKVIGTRAHAVLVRSSGVPVIEGVPSVAQFNRLLVVVDGLEPSPVWLDLSDEVGTWGSGSAGEGNLALTLAPDGGTLARRPLLEAQTSVSQIDEKLTLGDKGDLDARYEFFLTGHFAREAIAELHALKGDNLNRFFDGAVGNVSASAVDAGYEVGDLRRSDVVHISQHVSAPGYSPAQQPASGKGGKKFRILELPAATLGFTGIDLGTYLTKRTLPLWLGTPRSLRKDVSLTIPRGWKVAYLPADVTADVAGLSYSASCRTAGAVLTCHRTVATHALEVQPEKYDEFRAAVNRLADYQQRVVLLTQ